MQRFKSKDLLAVVALALLIVPTLIIANIKLMNASVREAWTE